MNTQTTEEIRARREMLQITQESLSELAGVGLRTLKLIESGKGNPTLSTLKKLTDALGLEIVIRAKQTET